MKGPTMKLSKAVGPRSAANKRPMTCTSHPRAGRILASMPKAMLADLVVDLLRAAEGEDLDGEELVARIVDAAEPVAIVRGWRTPAWWAHSQ